MKPEHKTPEALPRKRSGKGITRMCHLCGKSFNRPHLLKNHIQMHEGEPLKCRQCPLTFLTLGGRRRHEEIKHSESGGRAMCDTCGHTFSCKFSLDRHIKSHSGDKPFTCTICDKAFLDRSTLLRHHRTHTGVQRFSCTVCQKPFSDSGNLSKHMKIVHLGETPYNFKCEHCAKSFPRRCTLKKHQEKHHNIIVN